MRLGDVEIGPERFVLQAILVVVRFCAPFGEFFLIHFSVRYDPGRIQTADVSAFVVGVHRSERLRPCLPQIRGAIAPAIRVRRLLLALGEFRRAAQAAITHGVDEQDRALPIHPAGDEPVLCRVANEVEVIAVRVCRHNRAEIRFAQRLSGRQHFLNQPRLPLDVRPEPAIEVFVSSDGRDFFQRPEREAGAVGFGTESAEEIVFGKWATKLFGDFELSGAGERDDGIGAVAQPVERIIVRIAGPRLVVHQAHHQMRDLRIQAVGESGIGQVQLYFRPRGGISQRRRGRQQIVAEGERPVLRAAQLKSRETPVVFAGVAIQARAGRFPVLDSFIANGDRRRIGTQRDRPALVDAKLFGVPIEQPDRPAGRTDAADDDKDLFVALGQQAEVELPATLPGERPARAIKGRFGLNGRQFAVPQPDELLLHFVQRQTVAGGNDFPGAVGDPD